MSWWKSLLGLETDKVQVKADAVTPMPLTGRQDQDNFVTNRVSLQDYTDNGGGNALGLAVTWACVRLLAGTISTLPLKVYRRNAVGGREIAQDHPLYWLLYQNPNYDQTATDFWSYMSAAIELHGNAYAEIERTGTKIVSLTPIRPDAVAVRREGSEIRYKWTEGSTTYDRGQDDILHIRGFGGGPLGGASTLSVCRQTFGAALATERAASNMFVHGAMPSGVLSTDKALTADQRTQAELLLTQKFVGALNAGRPMLLDNGVKWEQLTISPEDAQMLETRRFGIEEVCRVFGVPPHLVGHTEKSTSWGTGLEAQTRMFYTLALRQRLEQIEQSLMKQLLTPGDRRAGVIIEFTLEGLLRGDSVGRAQVNEIYLRNKVITINEVRAQDNLPPVPWGGRPWGQMQDLQLNEDGTVPAAPPPGA